MPRIAGSYWKLGEAWDGLSLRAPEGTHPADTLILDADLWDCERIHVYCFKPHSLWCFIRAAPGSSIYKTHSRKIKLEH